MSSVEFKKLKVKTAEWLSAAELHKGYIVGDFCRIKEALSQLADASDGKIQLRRTTTRTGLCLHKDEIAWFCKTASLRRKKKSAITEIKTKTWLHAVDLKHGGYIDADIPEIRKALKIHQTDLPNYITMQRIGKKTGIYLLNTPKAIDAFRAISGYTVVAAKKTNRWLTPKELAGTYISASFGTIRRHLGEFQNDMPKEIQIKHSGGQNHRLLCLRNTPDAIKTFCAKANLQLVGELEDRTAEWLTAARLSKNYIQGDPRKILAALKKYQYTMPAGTIALKRCKTGKALCLLNNDDVIKEFCKQSGLIQAGILDGKSWLSARSLHAKKLIAGSYKEINKALKEWRKIKPEYVIERQYGKDIAVYLKNDSDVIAQFSAFYASPDRKTVKWLTAFALLHNGIVSGTHKKIEMALKEWQKTHPDDVLEKPFGNKRVMLSLRNDTAVIRAFCDEQKRKKEEWLPISALQKGKLVSGDSKIIESVLAEWEESRPSDISRKKHATGMILCLRNDPDVIKQFAEVVKNRKSRRGPKQALQWLSANELEYKLIDAGFSAIYQNLCLYQAKMRDVIQHKQTPNGQKLCLKRDAIEDFCKLCGLKAITLKTANWLSVKELLDGKYISGVYKNIKTTLMVNQRYKPEYVQMKTQCTGKQILCLLNDPDAILWLRRKLELSPLVFPEYAGEWVSVNNLSRFHILATPEQITARIQEIEYNIRNDVWYARDGKRRVLYLHRDSIEKFCQMAGFKMATDVSMAVAKVSSLVNAVSANAKQRS